MVVVQQSAEIILHCQKYQQQETPSNKFSNHLYLLSSAAAGPLQPVLMFDLLVLVFLPAIFHIINDCTEFTRDMLGNMHNFNLSLLQLKYDSDETFNLITVKICVCLLISQIYSNLVI